MSARSEIYSKAFNYASSAQDMRTAGELSRRYNFRDINKMWKNNLLAIFILLNVGCAEFKLKESDFLFPNNLSTFRESIPDGYSLEEYELKRQDGTMAYGILVAHPSHKITVMYFGGNQFNVLSNGGNIIEALTRSNVNVAMFDHRGYGRSTGKPTILLLKKDAVFNYDFVRSKVTGKLVVHGQSLGSFEAGTVAEHRTVDALVLESSSTNVDDWSSTLTPWYLKPFVNIEISEELNAVDNLNVVKKNTSPLLVIVGAKDGQTPERLSRKLFENAVAEHKMLHVFKNAGHNTVPNQQEFNAVYEKFLEKYVEL